MNSVVVPSEKQGAFPFRNMTNSFKGNDYLAQFSLAIVSYFSYLSLAYQANDLLRVDLYKRLYVIIYRGKTLLKYISAYTVFSI